ncbi:hypothetical protein N3K66_007293 [Trichothecium roseum]|uniref:Uncharacterized protein n=1 Tax=Trichothecium roseum TaxID=47278 RepID=A0ACC0UW31_9HYPO|nr:hypothetical protein N3K66_007293 [Trichothecium roseum]
MATAVNTTERLTKLRHLMKQRDVSVYIVPSEDNHSSEYIAASDARRAFISGFDGSAGVAIVTPDKAALFTDGRYTIQAKNQLDTNWTAFNTSNIDAKSWQDWTAESAEGQKTVAIDPSLLSASAAKKLEEKIKRKGGKALLPLSENLIDLVWGGQRPPRPALPVSVQGMDLAGKSVTDKLQDLRKELEKKQASGFVVSMLDEVAWLFNLRGNDIPFNPVFFSYAFISAEDAILYVDDSKLDDTCKSHLAANGVQLKPYESIFQDAEQRATATIAHNEKPAAEQTGRFLISNRASWALQRALGGEKLVEETRSPIGDAKAIKNKAELKGMRDCHIRDGAALIKYFAWLEDQLVAKKATLDEAQAADKLEEFRRAQDHYRELSFPTISSTGENAAVIHYKPEHGFCKTIDPDKIYLCDSGAQYTDGTTDTTRTLHFGKPADKEKEAYTLVLKGNISLDTAIFPKHTTGCALDTLARQHLWRHGLDYKHGTGHGVGSYLNVHEGPIGIGTRAQYFEVALSPGNVISNEPGYYLEQQFGIRIENVIIVQEIEPTYKDGDITKTKSALEVENTEQEAKKDNGRFLCFEHVTMVPYCQNLIDASLLTKEEKDWINNYNSEILEKTKPFFEDDPLTMAWLTRETQTI